MRLVLIAHLAQGKQTHTQTGVEKPAVTLATRMAARTHEKREHKTSTCVSAGGLGRPGGELWQAY